MELYQAIAQRRTTRDFQNATLPEETLERILGAGMKAPSNDHMRDWHFIVATDKAVVAKCLELIPPQATPGEIDAVLRAWNLNDPCQQRMYRNGIPKQYRMLAEASCLVIPLFRQNADLLHPENLSHLNGFASIWCCIENILLAATAEGYACALRIPLGDEAEWAREALGFPREYCMPCFLAIGKAKENAAPIEQKEYDVNERIHHDHW